MLPRFHARMDACLIQFLRGTKNSYQWSWKWLLTKHCGVLEGPPGDISAAPRPFSIHSKRCNHAATCSHLFLAATSCTGTSARKTLLPWVSRWPLAPLPGRWVRHGPGPEGGGRKSRHFFCDAVWYKTFRMVLPVAEAQVLQRLPDPMARSTGRAPCLSDRMLSCLADVNRTRLFCLVVRRL